MKQIALEWISVVGLTMPGLRTRSPDAWARIMAPRRVCKLCARFRAGDIQWLEKAGN